MFQDDNSRHDARYAKSEKAWIADPQGITWETFFTTGEATVYGEDNDVTTTIPMHKQTDCCAPEVEVVQVELKQK